MQSRQKLCPQGSLPSSPSSTSCMQTVQMAWAELCPQGDFTWCLPSAATPAYDDSSRRKWEDYTEEFAYLAVSTSPDRCWA